MTITQQLQCARAVLAKMRENRSRWSEAQAAIVAHLERDELLEQVSDELKGEKTHQVEVTK